MRSFDKAIALKSDFAEAYLNRGDALHGLKRHEEALKNYAEARALKPDVKFLYGAWLHIKMALCDWHDADEAFARVLGSIGRGEKSSVPFPILGLSSSPALQRKVADIFVRERYAAATASTKRGSLPRHEKIRVGYFSADFRNHAIAYLIAGLFELHDRAKFEVNAFYFGPNTDDEMRTRLSGATDRFIDVHAQSDSDVAEHARKLELDIAIDLTGLTKECRLGIFASRAAPVQVNYLGYPGTMAANYIDYLIADETLIPGHGAATLCREDRLPSRQLPGERL